jgi:hypothetical protein
VADGIFPANLGNLWRAIEWPTPAIATPKIVQKGSIINFHYVGQRQGHQIHDSYPLVLVSDIYSNAVRGVNLNYLTLPYVKAMITTFLERPFSYNMVKADDYIVGSPQPPNGDGKPGAFRSYKRAGISQLRMMDSTFLRAVAAVSRSLNPTELDQIRMQLEQLMRFQVNQPAAQPGPEETPPMV